VTLAPVVASSSTTTSWSPGAIRNLRKKIAVGLLNTANNDTKTWSSACSGERNTRISSRLIGCPPCTDEPTKALGNRYTAPIQTRLIAVIVPTVSSSAPNMRG
jgi:hypothetical protein